ncbi:Hypothetical predicted protein, partial [Pelobates cultripes]
QKAPTGNRTTHHPPPPLQPDCLYMISTRVFLNLATDGSACSSRRSRGDASHRSKLAECSEQMESHSQLSADADAVLTPGCYNEQAAAALTYELGCVL